MNLPMIPERSSALRIADIQLLEQQVSQQISLITNVEQLQEWQAQAAALASYLKGKDLHGPMLGAQRRVEARIGQLLGETTVGERNDLQPSRACEGVSKDDRQRFRQLARALELNLAEEVWRQSRRALIDYLQENYPVARQGGTVIQKDGIVKKPREIRIREIAKLALAGHRAEQIAEKLSMNVNYVRELARDGDVTLPDAAIGRRLKLNPARILTETINGIDAYVSGLTMLDDMDLPDLPSQERGELMQALSRSLNGLKKLRNRMEKWYAGSNASAA